MDKVFVIIVTYNGIKWIEKCLDGLRKSLIPLNVVVIDNASTDSTVEFINEKFPEVYLIKNTCNSGFGKANNIGIQYALNSEADYVFLLNQDAYLEPDTIQELIEISKKNPDYAILSPIQMNGDGTGFDKNFSIWVKSFWNYEEYKYKLENNLFEKDIYPVSFVMAAMWLIPVVPLRKIGGFDPLFSHYGEDDDYIERARYHGYKIGVCPYARGYHDRVVGNRSKDKRLNQNYARYLHILKNINKSRNFSALHCTSLLMAKSFKYALTLDMKSSFKNFKYLSALRKQYAQIYNHRTRSSSEPGCFLNDKGITDNSEINDK